MKHRVRLGCLAMTLMLLACSRKAEDPVTVTADEQSQLNDAAAVLDSNVASTNDADSHADSNMEESP